VLKKEVWEREKRNVGSGNAAKKLHIFSNYIIMIECYVRDNFSFIHSCGVWNCTKGI